MNFINIKHNCHQLLNKYISLELDSNLDYKYYCHSQWTINVNEFEGLSNSNKIVLKTKLDPSHVPIIMMIFHCLYEQDILIYFDFIDNINKIIIKEPINYEFNDIDLLFSYCLDYSKIVGVGDTYSDEERMFSIVPPIIHAYYSTKSQIIYKLEDIIV